MEITPSRFVAIQGAMFGMIAGTLALLRGWSPAETAAAGLQFALTTAAFAYIYAGRAEPGGRFINRVLGATMAKLSVGAGFLVLVLLYAKVETKIFVGVYLSTYFLFTFFEVYALLRNLRRNSQAKPKP